MSEKQKRVFTEAFEGGMRVVVDLSPFDYQKVFLSPPRVWFEIDARRRIELKASDHRLLKGASFGSEPEPVLMFLGKRDKWHFNRASSPLTVVMDRVMRPQEWAKEGHVGTVFSRLPEARTKQVEGEAGRIYVVHVDADVEGLSEKELEALDNKAFHGKRVMEVKAATFARNLYNAMWRRAVPLLDSEALRLARASASDVKMYNRIAGDDRLKGLGGESIVALMLVDYLEQRRNVEPDQILTRGITLEHLLRRMYELLGGNDPGSVSEGVLLWARKARLTPAYCPYVQMQVRMFRAIMGLNHAVTEKAIDRLKTPAHWRMLHTLLIRMSAAVPDYLKDPDAWLERRNESLDREEYMYSEYRQTRRWIEDLKPTRDLLGVHVEAISIERLEEIRVLTERAAEKNAARRTPAVQSFATVSRSDDFIDFDDDLPF